MGGCDIGELAKNPDGLELPPSYRGTSRGSGDVTAGQVGETRAWGPGRLYVLEQTSGENDLGTGKPPEGPVLGHVLVTPCRLIVQRSVMPTDFFAKSARTIAMIESASERGHPRTWYKRPVAQRCMSGRTDSMSMLNRATLCRFWIDTGVQSHIASRACRCSEYQSTHSVTQEVV